LRPPAVQSALQPLYKPALYKTSLYKAWAGIGLSGIGRLGAILTVVLVSMGLGGCSLSRTDGSFAKIDDEVTGSIGPARAAALVPTESDLAFARNAAFDVLTKGDKDSSQSWENPETGARGSVTPLAQAYSSDGRTCRDFLASYVKGGSESWLQGAACQSEKGRWEIHALKPWRQS
jgi:surface antigen